MLLALALAGCQPGPEPTNDVECPAEPLPQGAWFVGISPCSSVLIGDGEARRSSDVFVANSEFRGFIRAPQYSLSQLGVGGGTLIDFSAWNYRDRVHEVLPLVDGGWLDVDTFEVDGNTVLVGGTVASLPDRPAQAVGERREVVWRVEPDDPWLYVDGADGLYVHGKGPLEPMLDGHLVGTAVYGHDGGVVEDLGGAIRIAGASAITTAPPDQALTRLFTERTSLTGQAPGGEELLLLRGSETVWRVPLPSSGAFELEVPAEVDGVVAAAAEHAPSPRTDVGTGLELPVGAAGSLTLQLAPAVPATVTWDDDHGRAGTLHVHDGSARLNRGAASYTLQVDAGPAYTPWSGEVVVEPDASPSVDIQLERLLPTTGYVLVEPNVGGDRSRDWRGTDAMALSASHARGAGFTILAPRDDLPAAPPSIDDIESGDATALQPAGMTWRPGTVLGTEWGDIVVWPYTGNAQRNAHGAPSPRADALDTLASALRGNGRNSIVGLPFLQALGTPTWSVWPRPSLVRLQHPGPDPAVAWAAWWPWLDAGLPVMPVGPATWTRPTADGPLSATDVEHALLRGRSSAGTGPLVELAWGAAQAGDIGEAGASLHVHVWGCCALDRYAAIGEGGAVLAEGPLGPTPWQGEASVQPGRWVVFVVWSSTGPDWAVSGPIWLQGAAP